MLGGKDDDDDDDDDYGRCGGGDDDIGLCQIETDQLGQAFDNCVADGMLRAQSCLFSCKFLENS